MTSQQMPPQRLMGIFTKLADENEIPYQKLSEEKIVLTVESKHNTLFPGFQLQKDDDGYEYYTHLRDVPPSTRSGC